jgi:hypothetical protein
VGNRTRDGIETELAGFVARRKRQGAGLATIDIVRDELVAHCVADIGGRKALVEECI